MKPKHISLFLSFIFQEYSVQITFREDWDDIRLAYDDYNGRCRFEIISEVTKLRRHSRIYLLSFENLLFQVT